MIIIPTKWLYLGVYPIFRHTQMYKNGPNHQPEQYLDDSIAPTWRFAASLR